MLIPRHSFPSLRLIRGQGATGNFPSCIPACVRYSLYYFCRYKDYPESKVKEGAGKEKEEKEEEKREGEGEEKKEGEGEEGGGEEETSAAADDGDYTLESKKTQ